ncbi:hypothetical protein A4G20_09080 [Pasteurellaceae bacterium RH1A]|nr:hypothetical protein A4G20_09080 [Pasteurellaceae bacterium RH1A]
MIKAFRLQAGKFARFLAILTACFLLYRCEEPPKHPLEVLQPNTAPHTLTRAIYSAQLKLDPHFATVAADAALVRDIFTGLMGFDSQGKVVPALAQQWFSEDGREWIFLLDEWAEWSNKLPVTAQDFVASWQRLINPQNGSKLAPYLAYMGVKNAAEILAGQLAPEALAVEALNPHSLKITLIEPNFDLPNMLAHSALLPTFQGQAPDVNQAIITNGAYAVSDLSPTQAHLQAVENQAFFTKVIYQLITTAQNPSRFDLLENPLPHYKHKVKALPRQCAYFYEFNFTDPNLQKKPVRQAIIEMLKPLNMAAFGLANERLLPLAMQAEREKDWQPLIVEQLLIQAGISPHNPLKLTITYDSQGQHPQIANALIRTLGQSDLVHIVPQPVEWQDLLSLREQKQFQLIRSGWCADYPDPLQFVRPFHSQSPDNKSHYHNEEVDRLLDQAQAKQLSPEERLTLAQAVDDELKQDLAILPLFQYQRRIGLNSALLGIDFTNPSEVIYSKDLTRPLEEANEPTD